MRTACRATAVLLLCGLVASTAAFGQPETQPASQPATAPTTQPESVPTTTTQAVEEKERFLAVINGRVHTVTGPVLERGTVLCKDGVIAAMKGTAKSSLVEGAGVDVFVLGPDLKARGLSEDQVIDGVKVVGYDGFVDLCEERGAVNAWL